MYARPQAVWCEAARGSARYEGRGLDDGDLSHDNLELVVPRLDLGGRPLLSASAAVGKQVGPLPTLGTTSYVTTIFALCNLASCGDP